MTKLQTWTITGLGTLALVVGILLASGAISSAQSPTPSPSVTPAASGGTFQPNEDPEHEANETPEEEALEDAGIRPGGCGGRGGLIKAAAAEVLGLSEDELRTQLQAGQTLAQIAEAQGMSAEDLKAALTTKVTEDLQAKLDAGAITQEQFDTITGDLSARLDDIINSTGGLRFHGPGPGFGGGTRFRSLPSTDSSANTEA